jgi:predicted lipid-binding transport protein (Tim44 family)
MMFGGGMMLGIGLLMMLIFLGLPILLVVAVVAVLVALVGRRAGPVFPPPTPAAPASAPTAPPARYCAHCGQGLQADWTHCPKCGAPVEARQP